MEVEKISNKEVFVGVCASLQVLEIKGEGDKEQQRSGRVLVSSGMNSGRVQ